MKWIPSDLKIHMDVGHCGGLTGDRRSGKSSSGPITTRLYIVGEELRYVIESSFRLSKARLDNVPFFI